MKDVWRTKLAHDPPDVEATITQRVAPAWMWAAVVSSSFAGDRCKSSRTDVTVSENHRRCGYAAKSAVVKFQRYFSRSLPVSCRPRCRDSWKPRYCQYRRSGGDGRRQFAADTAEAICRPRRGEMSRLPPFRFGGVPFLLAIGRFSLNMNGYSRILADEISRSPPDRCPPSKLNC